jgi:cation:H+ antiporter
MGDIVELLLGLAILAVGADLLVRGAVGLAALLRIPHLIVGLTIVSFGTSAPELVVSLQAALRGAGGIAIGNVVGSNIANVLIVLGLPSLIRATALDSRGSNRNMLFMLAVTLLFIGLAWDGTLSRLDGLVLLALFALFFAGQAAGTLSARREGPPQDSDEEEVKAPHSPWIAGLLALVGLVSLPFGADMTVDGALGLAERMDLSETAVGVTIVALGTSLPELAAAVAAAIRGHSAVALGNVIGSNIFNILAILGITALVIPVAVPMDFFYLEMWAMLAATLLLVPFVLLSWPIGRLTGGLMSVAYVAVVVAFLAAPGY